MESSKGSLERYCGRNIRVTIRRNHGNIKNASSSQISLLECHGSTRKKGTLEVDVGLVLAQDEISQMETCLSRPPSNTCKYFPRGWLIRTYATLSNRAPVFMNRLNQTEIGSSQAVILSASSGTRSALSSSSVLVQAKAAISPPALVPVMTRGRRS